MPENQQQDPTHWKSFRWFQRGFAIFFVAFVIYEYCNALRVGIWPSGHPWFALFLLTFAVSGWIDSLQSSSMSTRIASRLRVMTAILTGLNMIWVTLLIISMASR
jgi:hypothetical protein